MSSLRCPFCNESFQAGLEWRQHFLSCPYREGGARPAPEPSSVSAEIRSIENRMRADQEEIDRLRRTVETLTAENSALRGRLDAARRALEDHRP